MQWDCCGFWFGACESLREVPAGTRWHSCGCGTRPPRTHRYPLRSSSQEAPLHWCCGLPSPSPFSTHTTQHTTHNNNNNTIGCRTLATGIEGKEGRCELLRLPEAGWVELSIEDEPSWHRPPAGLCASCLCRPFGHRGLHPNHQDSHP